VCGAGARSAACVCRAFEVNALCARLIGHTSQCFERQNFSSQEAERAPCNLANSGT